MSDLYQQVAGNPVGRQVIGRLGLPPAPVLRRFEPDGPLVPGPVLLGSGPAGRLAGPAGAAMRAAGVEVLDSPPADGDSLGALVFDASGIDHPDRLRELYEFFHPVVRRIIPSGRLVVLAAPEESDDPARAIAQRAIEGFTRSVGKELRQGRTAQLVRVEPGAEDAMASTLRFLLSGRSAYVSGQVIRIADLDPAEPADWDVPLAGKVVLVTGASQGIGAEIARVMARDGAEVVLLDIPGAGEKLAALANEIGGTALHQDVSDPGAPAAIAEHLRERHGGVDVVVHNAGVTRDKTLARMDDGQWDSAVQINLAGPLRITQALLDGEVLREGGRVVGVSSIAGIAGNAGQTNYGTSKAGVIGLVHALSPALRDRAITVNAVAPGFIETAMTAAMPFATREAGRRMNSMVQGGLPVDVAETIAWLASAGSEGVTDNVVRVCGQSLIGA